MDISRQQRHEHRTWSYAERNAAHTGEVPLAGTEGHLSLRDGGEAQEFSLELGLNRQPNYSRAFAAVRQIGIRIGRYFFEADEDVASVPPCL